MRVTTIHDLNYRLVPETHFGLRGLGMRVLVPLAARRSHRVIVDAESTRDDLQRLLRHAARRRSTWCRSPRACRRTRRPRPRPSLRARLELGERPIVLSLSAKRPHKNLPRLLRALAAIEPERRPVLVVPGYPTAARGRAARAGRASSGIARRWCACRPGSPRADLEGLYRAAACVVFPSLYEGFGLPVLEAMARGVPVACSNRSSLPEVAGDAALLFDPEDVEAIRTAIERLLTDARRSPTRLASGRARGAYLGARRAASPGSAPAGR